MDSTKGIILTASSVVLVGNAKYLSQRHVDALQIYRKPTLSSHFSEVHTAAISTECFSDGMWLEFLSFSTLVINTENSTIAHYVF